MDNDNLMRKSDMTVSKLNPLIKQIKPQKNLRKRLYITYNICETCNLNCLFCCINDNYHGKKFISIENSDYILNQLRNEYDIDTIFIMANEPTIQPKLANHIMRYAIKNKIKIKIVSNGFASIDTYQRMLENINPKDINKITISLDSMNEKIHNTLRNNDLAFDRAMRTIKYLKNNNYNIRIQMTICDINYDTIIDSVKRLNNEFKINNFAFHCMSLSDRAISNGLRHLSAFKWRRLVTNLFKQKNELKDIEEFSVPIIAMTENELLKLYFGGNRKLLNDFMLRKPLKLCPAINGNNVYLKANDDDVFISKCQILFDNKGYFSYKFDYSIRRFKENLVNNDWDFINNSLTLCPVILTEVNSKKDYEEQDGQKLYYVCRVLLANEKDLDY